MSFVSGALMRCPEPRPLLRSWQPMRNTMHVTSAFFSVPQATQLHGGIPKEKLSLLPWRFEVCVQNNLVMCVWCKCDVCLPVRLCLDLWKCGFMMMCYVFMCVARDSLCLFLSFLFLFHIRFLSIILPLKNVNFFTCYVNFSTCYYKTDRVRITTFTWVIINSLLVFWAPGSLLPDRVDFYGGVPSGGATEQEHQYQYDWQENCCDKKKLIITPMNTYILGCGKYGQLGLSDGR